MVDCKTVQIRYSLKGEPVAVAYQWDGFDIVNSILAYLVSLHVEPNLIPAQERMENGGIRNTQKTLTLLSMVSMTFFSLMKRAKFGRKYLLTG